MSGNMMENEKTMVYLLLKLVSVGQEYCAMLPAEVPDADGFLEHQYANDVVFTTLLRRSD
jgi:hypothetical protein